MQGRSQLPYPLPGYWALTVDANGSKALYVNDAIGATTISTTPLIFRSCDLGKCQGGSEFACEDGYTGLQCSECVKDMFNFQGVCENRCEDLGNPTAVTIFGIAAVVTVWLIMNFQTQ